MDQNPNNNQPTKGNNYEYLWLSPLRDIQPGIFNPETASNPEDNPISDIDSTLFTEGATNTSAEASSSNYVGYQHHDPRVNQPFHWPTMSTTVTNLTLNRTSRQTDTNWPTYQGQNARTTEANMTKPSTNSAYPSTVHPSDPLQRDHDSTERQSRSQECRNQLISNESDIRIIQNQSNTNWGQSNPQEREIHNGNHPHMPQYQAPPPQNNTIRNDANLPLAPIGTPSTSSGIRSSSTGAIASPQRTRRTRSPIRYPTPETNEVPTTFNLGWNSSNPHLHTSELQMDFTRTIKLNPQDVQLVNRNARSENMVIDHEPRGSFSHNTTNTLSRKRGAHSQSLPADARYPNYQQNKKHQTEKDVDKFLADMAKDMKQVIENTRNHTKPIRKWANRQHDAKGVSNFHLDRDDQIVRTNSGHPQCN